MTSTVEAREDERTEPVVTRHHRLLAVALAVILGVAMLGTRLWGLSYSLWWDEAYTAWAYVSRPGAIRDPERYLGNNHVLFSWLTNQTTDLTASTWEPVIRFWSVFPGLVGTAILVAWLWRRVGKPLALTTLGLLVISVAHAERLPEARGYGLVFLGSAVLITAGSEAAARRPPARADGAFVAGGVIGAAAIPTLALAAVPQGVAALVCRGSHRARLVVASGIGTGALVLWYWPLREPMLSYRTTVGSRSGDAVTPLNFLSLPFDHLMSQPLGASLPVIPGAGLQLISYVLAIAGTVWLLKRNRPLGVQAVAGLVGAMALMGIVGVHAHPRYLFFLLPHATILTAAGSIGSVEALRRRAPDRVLGPMIAIVVVTGFTVGVSQVIETRQVPRQAFSDSVQAVLERDVDVLYTDRLHIGYRWYLEDTAEQVVTVDAERLEDVVCGSTGSVAYLPYARSHTYPERLSCFDDPSWSMIDPPSVHPTAVWIREPAGPVGRED